MTAAASVRALLVPCGTKAFFSESERIGKYEHTNNIYQGKINLGLTEENFLARVSRRAGSSRVSIYNFLQHFRRNDQKHYLKWPDSRTPLVVLSEGIQYIEELLTTPGQICVGTFLEIKKKVNIIISFQ